ncbi:DNA-binding MarR family transcriptional regulator [Actinoalloteichus hoggarensis]|uniref:Putative HTH-type transcriptional regulator YusO n=1 Tax=Actinoalloteichus hoggarensis TaxID=1470176 RepID=A0A221W3J3_9PSEU|nr:MarR family transcriptional regulator [Actinoalloteichus hoggarensis]ASO20432.1 putative HTH-type transcriptional regulator YusO [Actinoalloteichus hoggarensis]MBB5923471.1 DNA-binding MarR family transcriptional regulator [Actinoalloteichus hoggarensis]
MTNLPEGAADRDAAVDRILSALPNFVNAVVQLNELIAERMGVVPTDLHCLHELHRRGPMTARDLAEHLGRSPGAVSRMIDRLDAAGCVHRADDPDDRRRVLISPTRQGLRRVADYYAGLTVRTRDDLADLDERGLWMLASFLTTGQESTRAEVDRLRAAR